MKKYSIWFLMIIGTGLLTSCEAVNTIFEAGMWWAFILIFAVVAVVIWIISKLLGGKK